MEKLVYTSGVSFPLIAKMVKFAWHIIVIPLGGIVTGTWVVLDV